MKTIKVALLFLMLFSISCSRKAEDTATVLIQIPSAQKLSSANYTTLSDDNPDDDDLNWSSDIPDGLITDSTASKPINCYAVMVEGPEPLMRANTCGRRNSTTRVIDTTLFYFKVGLWMGAIPGSSSSAPAAIPFEVPAGLARTFRLIGFHVQDSVDCVLLQGDPDMSKMSRPYVIAQSAPIDLVPGEKDVALQMVFDSEKWFDSCDFGGQNNSSPVIATKIQLRKESFPPYKWIQNSAADRCQALEVQLTDDSGRPAILPPGLTKVTYRLAGAVGGSAQVLNSFGDKATCKSNTSPVAFFDVLANSSAAVRRWVRIPLGTTAVAYNIAALEVSRSPIGTMGTIASEAMTLVTQNDNAAFMQLLAPQLALKDEVYSVELIQRRYDGDTFVAWTAASYTLTNATYFSFYNYDANQCLTTSLTSSAGNFVNGATDVTEKFCLSFTDIAEQYSSINIAGQSAGYFGSRGGGEEPQRLRVLGSNQISRPVGAERCFGPFMLVLENEYGAAVKNKDASAVQVSYSYRSDSPVIDTTATVPIELHTTVTQSGTAPNFAKVCPAAASRWTPGSAEPIVTSDYYIPFYIKVPQTATLGWRYLSLTGTINGRIFKGSFRFSIDVED